MGRSLPAPYSVCRPSRRSDLFAAFLIFFLNFPEIPKKKRYVNYHKAGHNSFAKFISKISNQAHCYPPCENPITVSEFFGIPLTKAQSSPSPRRNINEEDPHAEIAGNAEEREFKKHRSSRRKNWNEEPHAEDAGNAKEDENIIFLSAFPASLREKYSSEYIGGMV